LDTTLWFIHILSSSFETRYLSPEYEEGLVLGTLSALYLIDDDRIDEKLSYEIVNHALKTLVNITKCSPVVFGRDDPRSDFATLHIINYEK
jgi:hypothetical protein